MRNIVFNDDQSIALGGERLVIDMSLKNRRASDASGFTLVKNQGYIRFYQSLASSIKPAGILELGIFEGGSYVLFDKLFEPLRMSAIDIREQPVEALVTYVKQIPNHFLHFGTSQTNSEKLRQIVAEDLDGKLDLVIDDASHSYAYTKASFDILFPLLSPGGVYVVEDWSWAHHPAYQGPDSPFSDKPALTNLLFEQIMLLGSNSMIGEIRIRKPLYVIHKAQNCPAIQGNLWDNIQIRGRSFTQI